MKLKLCLCKIKCKRKKRLCFFFCNTGWFASTVWFALSEVAGIENVKLYDGSLAHWTLNPKNEVINGQI